MTEMIATSNIDYPPSKSHKPGERFEVDDAHVELLLITGRAKLPDESQPEDSIEGTLHVKRKYTKRVA